MENETAMTLSPAAQAVLDACLDENCNLLPSELRIVAAALRAAANQVIGEVFPVEAILDIAAEL